MKLEIEMPEAFEKILERLEEERELSYADFSRYVDEVSPCLDAEYDDFFHRGLERASRLVKEVAKEYNCGWIPCSERLPEDDKKQYIVQKTNGFIDILGFTKDAYKLDRYDFAEYKDKKKQLFMTMIRNMDILNGNVKHGNHYQNHLRRVTNNEQT